LRFPTGYGGSGLRREDEIVAIEEVGVLGTALASAYVMPRIVGEAINTFGSPEQKERWLTPLLSGEKIAAEALTEPRGGSDFFGTTTEAQREGDHYILRGQKRFIVGAAEADFFLVYARTDTEDSSRAGNGYDALYRRTAMTDTGDVTRYAYDDAGRLVAVTEALGGVTRYGYDAEGRQTVVTDTLGDVTRYGYDLLGRTTVITDPLGEVTHRGYDANGNLITVTNALSAATVYGYDGLDRRVWERDALGFTTTYEYDLVGNRTAVTDAAGRVTRYGYDGLGRALSVTDALSGTTRYGYDAVGNVTVITNANGHTTTYAYNFLDQVTRKTNPLGKSWWYAYDDAGHLIREVDAEWQATYYEYDGAGRRTAIIYGSAGQRVDLGYDAVGNRTVMADAAGVTTYVYDALDRPITVTSPLTGVVGYRYDMAGNRTQIIYPDPSTGSGQGGKVVTHTYDAANRLASVVDWAGQTTTYGYDAAGRLVTETLPNGVRTVSIYDDADRLTRLTHRRLEDGEMLGDYQFALDEVGNRVVVTETLAVPTDTLPITTVIHYTYDALGRPTRVNHSSGERFAYVYDLAGNVLTYTRSTADQEIVTVYSYNAANQLVAAEADDEPVAWHYAHDANGNLTEVTPGDLAPDDGARRYSYDRAGRLVRVETHDGTAYRPQAEMVYNGLGQRVSLIAWTAGLSLTTRYVLDPLDEARPLAASAAGQTTFYVYGRGPLAELTDEWTYYLDDGNRTVRQLSDADGAITLARSYTPWGELLMQRGGPSTGSGQALPWGYFGGLLDAATGLIYVGSGQYYDPRTGRFLSPIGSGRNPYVPTSPGDPLGALLGMVALAALLVPRRRGRRKRDEWLLGLMLVLAVGMSIGLAACEPTPPPDTPPQPPTTPPGPGPSPLPPTPSPAPSPTPPPSATPTCTPVPTPTPTSIPDDELEDLSRITPEEISQAGGLSNYLWGESDALTLTRVATGESHESVPDQELVMWIIKMRAELGYSNSSSRGFNPPPDRWGASTSIKVEALNPGQFECVETAYVDYKNYAEDFNPETYDGKGNLRAMLSPVDINDFRSTYEMALALVNSPISSMPEELKGFDGFLSSNAGTGVTFWEGGLESSQLRGANVYNDSSWFDNIYFGLVTCEYVLEHNSDHPLMDLQCPGTPTPTSRP
jgi:YD repeat-containing protein